MTKLHEVVENIKFGTIRQNLPEIKIGDLVRVGVAIQEGNKETEQNSNKSMFILRVDKCI